MAGQDDLTLARACARTLLARDPASRHLGMTVEIPEPGAAVVTMTVRETMVNGHGLCHGGYLFTLADSAFAFACNGTDRVTVATGADVEFLAPAQCGDTLTAVARQRHQRGRSGLWDVAVHNQRDEALALFRGRALTTRRTILASNSD